MMERTGISKLNRFTLSGTFQGERHSMELAAAATVEDDGRYLDVIQSRLHILVDEFIKGLRKETVKAVYDAEADAVYVTLRDVPYVYGEDAGKVDGLLRIDFGADNEPVGYEFLHASYGVDLRGIEHSDVIAEELEKLGIATEM